MDILNNKDKENDLITKLITYIFEKYQIKLTRDDPIFTCVLLNKEVLREFLNEINSELRLLPSALETVYIDSIKTLDRDFNNKINLISEAHNESLKLLKTKIIGFFSEDYEVNNSLINLTEEIKKSFKKEIDDYTSLYKKDLEELRDITKDIHQENIKIKSAHNSKFKTAFFSISFLFICSIVINIVTYTTASNKYSRLVKIISLANDKYQHNDAIDYIINKYDED